MKKEFVILKNKPNVEIKVTRDSVCMADDCDAPHERNITQPSFIETDIFIKSLISGYLPTVQGTRHTWDCFLNNTLIGTASISGVISKVVEVEYREVNHVHFKYNSATY